jgi:putative flippase GtrA
MSDDMRIPSDSRPVRSSGKLRRQLLRFGVVGLLATVVHLSVYAILAKFLALEPQPANLAAFVMAVPVSFAGQAAWTFHEQVDGQGLTVARLTRFCFASLTGLALNSLFVHIVTITFNASSLAALPLMAVVTPALLFALNRFWVFGPLSSATDGKRLQGAHHEL